MARSILQLFPTKRYKCEVLKVLFANLVDPHNSIPDYTAFNLDDCYTYVGLKHDTILVRQYEDMITREMKRR